MADWATISSLGTAGGTLVLAVATFASVRSANRTARLAERSMLVSLRPVLAPSRDQDPVQEVLYGDGHAVHLPPGIAMVEETGANLYLTLGLRNAGAGLAVLQAGRISPTRLGAPPGRDGGQSLRDQAYPDVADFRRLQRDIYISPGDVGFWQAAIRERDEDDRWPGLREAVGDRRSFTVDLLYGDFEGGQSTISRFGLFPPQEGDAWLLSVGRHWSLDGADPR